MSELYMECDRLREQVKELKIECKNRQKIEDSLTKWVSQLNAQLTVTKGALKGLIKEYWSNKGTEYEFITCITPDGIPECWLKANEVLTKLEQKNNNE